jgi:hypothetical protein
VKISLLQGVVKVGTFILPSFVVINFFYGSEMEKIEMLICSYVGGA